MTQLLIALAMMQEGRRMTDLDQFIEAKLELIASVGSERALDAGKVLAKVLRDVEATLQTATALLRRVGLPTTQPAGTERLKRDIEAFLNRCEQTREDKPAERGGDEDSSY